MTSLTVPLILVLLINLTNQQRSWWLTDEDFFYDHPFLGPSIYNSVSGNSTTIRTTYPHFHRTRAHLYSRDLNYVAEMNVKRETNRNPDRVLFSVLIKDKLKKATHTVGLSPFGDSVLAFKWSHSSAYAFVLDEDIYYVDSLEQPPIRITNRGEDGMTHGAYDFGSNGENLDDPLKKNEGSMWFAPSNKFLAYQSFPTNSTKKVVLTTYDRAEKYDYNYYMDYVKTGEKDFVPSISIWSVETNQSRIMNIQFKNSSSFHYLFGVSWVTLHGKEILLTTWANRWQNETEITLCSYETASCSSHRPLRHCDLLLTTGTNGGYFLAAYCQDGNNGELEWMNSVVDDLAFKSISFLPSGEYDVRRILAYRPDEDIVIYDAQAPNSWNRHFYATPAAEGSALEEDRCLTCLSVNCTFQRQASVSRGTDLKIAYQCCGPNTPHHAIVSFNATLDQQDAQIISKLMDLNVTEWTTETFLHPSGYEAIVRIYHGDTGLDSVPVTLNVYGGPMDFNQVTDVFGTPLPIGYKQAVVYMDVRGSGGRGWKYRSPIYRRLVTVEVEDTLEAMKMVLAKYPRLDKNRVGVFGWSYGGTMSIALEAPKSFFKCAISVAPVTNFANYGASYTERFMGDAPHSSYTDLTRNVSAFHHTKLLLVHGMRDDVVLFQHSALMIEALQQADIPFQLMVYPNQDHNIRSGHLQHLFESFMNTCYK